MDFAFTSSSLWKNVQTLPHDAQQLHLNYCFAQLARRLVMHVGSTC